VLWIERQRIGRVLTHKYFWGFFLSFIVIASPLFIRNMRVYGTPLFSNSRYVLWVDQWREYDQMKEGRAAVPSLRTYFESHTPKEFLNEITLRSAQRDSRMLVDGLKPFAFWESEINLNALRYFHNRSVSWQETWAAVLLALFIGGLIKARRHPATTLAVMSTAIFLLFVGWYSKIFHSSPPTRLLYPILVLILMYAAHAFALVFKVGLRERILSGMAVMFCAFYIFSVLPQAKAIDFKQNYRIDPYFLTQFRWIYENLPRGEKLIVGKGFLNYAFYFKNQLRVEVQRWPTMNRFSELEDFVRDEGVRHGILDLATVVNNYTAYRDHFLYDRYKGLKLIRPLPPWVENIPTDPNMPPFYKIYRFNV